MLNKILKSNQIVIFNLKSIDQEIHTGGGLAWLPWRVSYIMAEELGIGRGIWLGSIFDVADTGAPVWPIGGMEVIDWFGRGCGGIPNILGGCAEPGIGRGGVAYRNSKFQKFRLLTRLRGMHMMIYALFLSSN